MQLVERLHDKGIGVLMTTHFPDHALLLDCETAILSRGGVVAQGPAHDVVNQDSLQQIYGIPINIATIGARQVCVPGDLDDPLGRIEKFETGSTKRGY